MNGARRTHKRIITGDDNVAANDERNTRAAVVTINYVKSTPADVADAGGIIVSSAPIAMTA